MLSGRGWGGGGGKSVPCPFVLQRFKKAPAVGAFNISSTNGHFTVVHEGGGFKPCLSGVRNLNKKC